MTMFALPCDYSPDAWDYYAGLDDPDYVPDMGPEPDDPDVVVAECAICGAVEQCASALDRWMCAECRRELGVE